MQFRVARSVIVREQEIKEVMNKYWPPCVGILGFILLLSGMIFTFYVVPFIENIYFSQEILKNGTSGYEQFVNPSLFPRKFKVYFFDVVNAEDVMGKNEEPVVEEVGPYVYDIKIMRTIESLDFATETVEFFETYNYIFNAKESKDRTEDDMVMMVNLILSTAETKLKTDSLIPKVLEEGLREGLKMKIFEKVKVKDILFNGLTIECSGVSGASTCQFFTMAMGKSPHITTFGDKLKISLFGHVNNTKRGPFKAYVGFEQFARGSIVSFEGLQKWRDWKPPGECHILRGSTFTFPPLPFAAPQLYIFLSELCRSMPFDFGNYTNVKVIPAYSYVSTKKPFDNIKENACYCKGTAYKQYSLTCNLKGTMDLIECRQIPIIASYPHFYLGDPALRSFFRGLEPRKELHESFVSIEPKSGVRLSAAIRFQLNVKLNKLNQGDGNNINDVIFPLLWTEDVTESAEALITYFETKLFYIQLLHTGKYTLSFSGIFIMLLSVVLLAYRERYLMEYRQKKRDDFSAKILTESVDLNKVNVNLYPQLINRNVCDSFDRKNELTIPKF